VKQPAFAGLGIIFGAAAAMWAVIFFVVWLAVWLGCP
jgi:hypothetical protein